MAEQEKVKLSSELKKIKKLYGEDFMHLCRELFPTLLEKEGTLTKILETNFATNSRSLYQDIRREGLEEEFKNYIYSMVDVEKETIEIIEKKTPYELLDEAGYDLYECRSEEEIQSFKKYYKRGEELCTFRGNRLNRCVVFWAVKKDVENILRKDFKTPRREDEYGTSVMSIQFSRGENSTVSIKNRYNHTVNNPDATYGNDLDKIAPGLTESFKDLLAERNMKLNSTNIEKFCIPNYVFANDGKYYKYNMEICGIYYCPGNIIIDHGQIIQLEAEKQILIDNFILDKMEKNVNSHNKEDKDSFLDDLKEIKNIDIRKKGEKGERLITINTKNSDTPIEIEIDRDNNIIGYKNENLKEAGDDFLFSNKKLRKIETPNLEKVGKDFLPFNEEMEILKLENLRETGECFFSSNKKINTVELPKLERAGKSFLYSNNELINLELPNLKEVDSDFLHMNYLLRTLNLPKLERVGIGFLESAIHLTNLEMPNLKEAGSGFLLDNREIDKLHLPKLKVVGDNFLTGNEEVSDVKLPELEEIGTNFLCGAYKISSIELPKLKQSKLGFLNAMENDYFNRGGDTLKRLVIPENILEKVQGLKSKITNNKGELIETESTNIVEDNLESNIKKISKKDIAKLSQENGITMSEVNFAKRFIDKIKDLFKQKRNGQRGEN